MIFYKTVSAGNDFIHINTEELSAEEGSNLGQAEKERLAISLCRNKLGAGADGVVFYTLRKETVDFEIFNSDGSEAELSGNGMAGLTALVLYLKKFQNQVILNTRAGQKTHKLLDFNGNSYKLKIEIGKPDFHNSGFFPFLKSDKLDYLFNKLTFYPVSVGNPHAVVLMDKNFPEKRLLTLGKMIESADIFPHKTNVEFVSFKPPKEAQVFFFERGVGQTRSSSTGSAAVFAVLQKLNLIKENLNIKTFQEILKISGRETIYIENFTKIVYKGVYLNH
jgi:diaminopimelate epimerase